MFRKSVTVSLLVLGVALLAQGASSAGKPYLGISLAAKIPPSVAAHLEIEGGAMIIAVIDGSPAAQAGLRKHDIIVKAAGMKVNSRADLQKALAAHNTGDDKDDALKLVVRRGAATFYFCVKPAEAPPKRAPLKRAPAQPAAGAKAYLGVHLEGIPASLAAHLKLSAGEGVLVEKSLPGSPAYKAGLQKHDVILKVSGKAVTSNRRSVPGTIILPNKFRNLQLRGIRGGITGGLRFDSFESLFGNSQNGIASNLNELIIAHKPGDEIELAIVRQGEKKKLKVVLATAPSRARSFFAPPADFPPQALRNRSSSSSSVTVSDGELTITVLDTNGKKTFSVRRGSEVIAENEPWDALDKMPEDIQKSIRRLNRGTSGKPLPPEKKKRTPGEEKRKPI